MPNSHCKSALSSGKERGTVYPVGLFFAIAVIVEGRVKQAYTATLGVYDSILALLKKSRLQKDTIQETRRTIPHSLV